MKSYQTRLGEAIRGAVETFMITFVLVGTVEAISLEFRYEKVTRTMHRIERGEYIIR